MYFTNVGGKGPVRDGEYPSSIGVLESRDNHMTIGAAHPVGRTDRGFALWKLVIHGGDIPGRWIILDRQFIKIQ
jgi:hypothetical protein